MFHRKISTATCRSVIPRLREYREAQLILNFLNVATQFSPRMQGSIFSFRPPSEAIYLLKSTDLNNRLFCALRHNPHRPKIPKNAITIHKCHYSN